MGFLLLVSLVISAILAAVHGALGRYLPQPSAVLDYANTLASFAVITALFAMIFVVGSLYEAIIAGLTPVQLILVGTTLEISAFRP